MDETEVDKIMTETVKDILKEDGPLAQLLRELGIDEELLDD